MRVLVTGATGFIGRHVLPLLHDQGVAVAAPRVDLLDPRSVRALMDDVRPSHLLHLAWCARPPDYLSSPENLAWQSASLGLIEAFASAGGRRAVIAGTCAEYTTEAAVCREGETPLAPATVYGASKHRLQIAAESFCAGAGLEFAWGRVFYAYGPHEHPRRFLPRLVGSLLAGEPVEAPADERARDYVHVEDVAAAFAALVPANAQGPFNLATGIGTPVRSFVEAVARLVGRPELVRYRTGMPGPSVVVADIGRLRREVGWRPRVTLEEGLQAAVQWWRRA